MPSSFHFAAISNVVRKWPFSNLPFFNFPSFFFHVFLLICMRFQIFARAHYDGVMPLHMYVYVFPSSISVRGSKTLADLVDVVRVIGGSLFPKAL